MKLFIGLYLNDLLTRLSRVSILSSSHHPFISSHLDHLSILSPILNPLSSSQDHLFTLESTLSIPEDEKPLYVVYPDESSKWRIQCVPVSIDSFTSRKPLPEQWRGLRDDTLSEKSGIQGCIFVHASGFIGGESREMAKETES